MAYLTIEDSEKAAKAAVERAIKANFSEFQAGDKKLKLQSVEFGKDSDPFDYEAQKDAKIRGTTWGAQVYGVFTLEDSSGKVLDRGRANLLKLPQKTGRHTFLYGGQEYQFDTQFRLKPGIYTRVTDRGEFASRISAEGKFYRKTEIFFEPESKKYVLNIGTSKVPLAVLLDLMGVSKADLDLAVGEDIAKANAVKPKAHEYAKLYKSLFKEDPKSPDDYQRIVDAFTDSSMDPDATEYTTGKRLSRVDKTAILTTMSRLLGLVQGKQEEDDPNSLVTKSVLNYDDYLEEWIAKSVPDIKRKVAQKLPGATKVVDVVPSGGLNSAISKLIMSPLAQRREQHNILDIVTGAQRTTLRGPGGISDPNMIRDDMRTIHPSQMAFLDPVKTPEGESIGTSLYVSQTAFKEGKELKAKFVDLKTGKTVDLSPKQAYTAVIAFPDEYDFSGAKPKAKRKKVQAAYKGDTKEFAPDKVQYVPASPLSLFTTTTNLIPFIRSNNGVRAMTASRQVEQAISLKDREAPLVQVKHGLSDKSTEEVLGRDVGATVSPVDGKVKAIKQGKIVIEDSKGNPHTANYYRNFPLNNSKGYIDSEIKVSVGDKVKKGQVIADTNYTKDGALALGTNLSVAYTPYKGLTFEDAVVVSETAAKKLTSDHMHQFTVEIDDTSVVGKRAFTGYFPNEITGSQAAMLDEDGVIQKGQEVHKGDFIYAGLGERVVDPDSEAVMRVSKGAMGSYSDRSVRWEKTYPGIVTEVQKVNKKYVVHVKTREPAVEGDKIVGRHGNKGIISRIIPDSEMPRSKDGKPFEILMNPAGVVGRVNLGQVFETLVGKVAKKTGKPVVVDNFDDSQDTYDYVKGLLKQHGLSDSETVIDPVDGETENAVLTGQQYVYKLTHQVDKKLVSRGAVSKTTGERLSYTTDMAPGRGSKSGGQSIGILDTYALLAHGATENLKDMFTYKSDAQNNLYWNRLKTGGILPEAEVPYTAKKFLDLIEGMGVHVKKDGDKLHFMPLTDRDVEKMSGGALTSPGEALDNQRRAKKGGIFDPTTTGGMKGTKWSHIELPEPVLNPIMEDGARKLLQSQHPEHGAKLLDKIMDGKVGLNSKGDIVAIKEADVVGGAALKKLLSKIDVDSALKKAQKDLDSAPVSKINVHNKTVKYLQALKSLGYTPDEAYTLTKMPVIPPQHRPVIADASTGKIEMDDVNGLYKKLGETVEAVKGTPSGITPESRAQRSAAIQDMVKAVTMSGYTAHNRPMKSLLQQISGTKPKHGFYQRSVLKRRQELSGRSTIVPNPELGMDEIEVPEKALWEMYSPFVTKSLVKSGYSVVDAMTQVKDKTDVAREALKNELEDRPVLMKRDPVLHKFGIQAFTPKISAGNTIRIPPSVTAGYGADFDGDAVGLFVPSTEDAKEEAKKLKPSQNLFSPKGGGLMHRPEHEAQLGLYMLTEEGRKLNFTFTDMAQALEAYKNRRIKLNDTFMYKGRRTSLGRLLLANSIPKGRIHEKWYTEIAYNERFRMDKKQVQELVSGVAKIQPKDFPQLIMQLRQLGDQAAFKLGGGFNIDDFKPIKAANKMLPDDASTKARMDRYISTREKVEEATKQHLRKNKNNLMRMVDSGARGKWDQLKQINLSPGLMTNSEGKVLPKPVNRSYSQGLSLSEYWTTMHGGRRGMVSKSRGTALPGYLSRQIISSVADVRVAEENCQTTQGVYESVTDRDIIGRYLAKSQKVGKTNYPAGTLVDDKVITAARTANVQRLFVRTPVKCESHDGICAKCYGKWHDGTVPPVGTNIGIISGQSLGEPSTQLSMKLFHEGGLYSPTAQTVDAFQKANELLKVPKSLKDEAVLAKATGRVSQIKKTSTGSEVFIGSTRHFVPGSKKVIVKVGDQLQKGRPVSDGSVNVHGLVELAGVGAAQDHLVSEIHGLYKNEGVSKKHVETVVRHMTNLGVVQEAPEGSGFSRGDTVQMSTVDAFNKRYVPLDWAQDKKLAEKYHKYGKGTVVTEEVMRDLKANGVFKVRVDETGYIKAAPVVRGVGTLPLDRTDDPLAQMSYERIKQSVETGALRSSMADLSGKQPLPAIGFGKIK